MSTKNQTTTSDQFSLPQPHGGDLVDLLVSGQRADELKNEAVYLPSWDLTERPVCDLELLLNGGFSPLQGFLGKADYDSVVRDMRLSSGVLWPIPVTLDTTEAFAEGLSAGSRIVLRHPEGMILAILTISDVWQPDKEVEAEGVFGTTDDAHPGVFTLINLTNPIYVGGTLEGIELPPQHTFIHLRKTPTELRQLFADKGWNQVVAFQTRNPVHRAHVELMTRAAQNTGAKLLLHPVVGMTKPGDVDYFVRTRCYEAVMEHFDKEAAALSLLPLAMRMGGPREAVWHAIIRKNYGCSHFIVGRDHAGPGSDESGKPFYGPYEAQETLGKYSGELDVTPVPFEEMVYVQE